MIYLVIAFALFVLIGAVLGSHPVGPGLSLVLLAAPVALTVYGILHKPPLSAFGLETLRTRGIAPPDPSLGAVFDAAIDEARDPVIAVFPRKELDSANLGAKPRRRIEDAEAKAGRPFDWIVRAGYDVADGRGVLLGVRRDDANAAWQAVSLGRWHA